MDGRIGHFSYLIEEVESDFFQKAAEEIAKEEAKTFPAVPERFQKLATLVYQSNQHGLTKQASEDMFDAGTFSSYENILNKVAASAYWEPLGMTKSAMDLLTVLEEAEVDEDELTKFAEYILEDTIGTDALIEASMEKEAGDARPIEEIYDELVKIARFGILKGIGKLFKRTKGPSTSVPSGFRSVQQKVTGGIQTMGREGKRLIGKAVGKPRRIQRLAEATRRMPAAIRGKAKGFVDKLRLGKIRRQGAYMSRLQGERRALKSHLETAGPGKAREIGEQLKRVNKDIESVKGKMRTRIQKRKSALRESGVERNIRTTPPPKKAPKPTEEGAAKAREAATPPPKTEAPPKAPDPTGAPKPKGERSKAQVDTRDLPKNLGGLKGEGPATRKKPVGSVDTSEAERAAKETGERMRAAGAKGRGDKVRDFESAKNREAAERVFSGEAGVTPKAETKGSYRARGEKKTTGGAPEQAPGPRPPQEAVEGKGMGVMDAWTKWGKDGWGALSDAEKSRLIRAGVMAGGGAAAYKTVFGD